MKVFGTVVTGETTLWGNYVFHAIATDEGLHFAYVANRFYQEQQQVGSLQHVAGAGGAAAAVLVGLPAIKEREEMQKKVDAVVPGSAEFLALHKKNFSVRPSEVLSGLLTPIAKLQAANGTGLPFRGSMELRLTNSKKRRFFFVDFQPANDIQAFLRQSLPSLEGSF